MGSKAVLRALQSIRRGDEIYLSYGSQVSREEALGIKWGCIFNDDERLDVELREVDRAPSPALPAAVLLSEDGRLVDIRNEVLTLRGAAWRHVFGDGLRAQPF